MASTTRHGEPGTGGRNPDYERGGPRETQDPGRMRRAPVLDPETTAIDQLDEHGQQRRGLVVAAGLGVAAFLVGGVFAGVRSFLGGSGESSNRTTPGPVGPGVGPSAANTTTTPAGAERPPINMNDIWHINKIVAGEEEDGPLRTGIRNLLGSEFTIYDPGVEGDPSGNGEVSRYPNFSAIAEVASGNGAGLWIELQPVDGDFKPWSRLRQDRWWQMSPDDPSTKVSYVEDPEMTGLTILGGRTNVGRPDEHAFVIQTSGLNFGDADPATRQQRHIDLARELIIAGALG